MSKAPQAAVTAAHNVRRNNLFALVGVGLRFQSQAELANALDVTEPYLSHFLGKKPRRRISEVSARKFEHKLGMPVGALDQGS